VVAGADEVFIGQLTLGSAVTPRAGGVSLSQPAASATGYIGDKGPFGASNDIGPTPLAASTERAATPPYGWHPRYVDVENDAVAPFS
jgi:hypothetical protein